MQKILPQKQLKSIWKKFISGESVQTDLIRPVIIDSWERCKKNKVGPHSEAAPMVVSGQGLEVYLNKHRELLHISLPVMENLYRFVAGGGFLIVLSNNEGVLLTVIGDKKLRRYVEECNFIPGASLAEDKVGTNAIGTSLLMDQPLQVFGYEHYRAHSHRWFCSAAPIHDPDGNIIGVIDITGIYKNVHNHTLGMVVTAANAIEAQLKVKKAFHSLEVANNYKNTIIESISEGLVAVDFQGYITHINEVAAYTLGVRPQEVLNKKIYSILDEGNNVLIDLIKNNRFVTDHEINIMTKNGAANYLVTSRPINKNNTSQGIVIIFLEIARARSLVNYMGGTEVKFDFTDLVGQHPKFLETVELAVKASGSISNVLLLGESGTGKDVFAQAIHRKSTRRKGPFIAINCSAIPRELIASELFGYAEGAFTGAKRGGKPGKFELASGGTIFLDEIGEMPLDLQTTLLRVLETKTITRLGGNETIPVDVRIIAATNKDLRAEVVRGNFRQDLFYRLNVINIHMVSLRERKEDIPLLVDRFLKTMNEKLHKNQINEVDPKVIELFKSYYWPGNIRELQNVLERAVNICTNPVLTPKFIPPEIASKNWSGALVPVASYELELIKDLIEKNNRNITLIAKKMGIARTTLYRKLVKYNLL